MEGSALVVVVVIGLFVLYNLGVFGALGKLVNVANREADDYDQIHKVKSAKKFLSSELTINKEELTKIKAARKAIDDLPFD